MVYEVRLPDGNVFELERDEPATEGIYVRHDGKVYEVVRVVLPETDDYDGILEVEWRAEPARPADYTT